MLLWLFLMFRDQWNSARDIFRKCPWKPIHRVYWVLCYPGYLICTQFWHYSKITFQCNFKCKTCLARYDHLCLICGKSSNTMAWPEKKSRSNTCMTFMAHKQKISSIVLFFVISCLKFVCYVRFAGNIKFCCGSDWQCIYGWKNRLIWKKTHVMCPRKTYANHG